MDKKKENTEIDVDEILEKIIGYFGFVPKILQVLSENPSALKVFFDKSEMMMVDESLSAFIKEFIFIGAAAATGSVHCLQTHLDVAREFGASDEQLLLAIIIGASVAETTALAQSLRVYEKFKD